MNVELTAPGRQQLRQLQKQRRDEDGYVAVTVILLLDKRRPLARSAPGAPSAAASGSTSPRPSTRTSPRRGCSMRPAASMPNARSACYEQLLTAHPDKARYYQNKELRARRADKPFCQVFLPPYLPNLNLMERFWKYLRQKIINTLFYRTKDQFRTAVFDFFDRLPKFRPDLASLLTRKFHILDS